MAGRTFSLEVVQERARSREEEAGRRVGLAAARLAEGQRKATMLQTYRDQYAQQLAEHGGTGIDVGRLRDTLAFIARIDEALRQQAEEVTALHQRWQAAVAEWNERNRESRTYDVLEQRHRDRLAAGERRQEQRITDEWATRRGHDDAAGGGGSGFGKD